MTPGGQSRLSSVRLLTSAMADPTTTGQAQASPDCGHSRTCGEVAHDQSPDTTQADQQPPTCCSSDHVTTTSCIMSPNTECDDDTQTCMVGAKVTGLEGMDILRLGEINYFQFSISPDLLRHQQRVRHLTLRPDDVITVGFPRSGNHWTFEVVNMILHQRVDFEKDHFYSRLLEYLGENIQERLDSLPSPRNMTSHYRLHHLPVQVREQGVKVIYVMRNPKDVLVSLYNFSVSLAHERSRFSGTWSQFLDLQMAGEFPWGAWWDHVSAAEAFIGQFPGCPVHVLVYERLKREPAAEIGRLCRFLARPDSLAEEIARATEFSHMKAVLSKTKMAEQGSKHFKNGASSVLRAGQVGGWRDWFSAAQSEAFDRLFQEKMSESKLAALVRPFM